ncbi:hypothetical protein ACHAQA_006118 [Verticillium albo-atrum]
MPFTVLSDAAVKALFDAFTPEDVNYMSAVLRAAFRAYSLDNEAQYQPHRAAVTRASGQTSLFMPATTPDGLSVKIVGVPPPKAAGAGAAGGPPSALRCVLTLCDAEGRGVGVINAEAFTAFRTSLGSILLYQGRRRTARIVVFGAGKQALWHLRLALLLRGAEIEGVTVVNRSRGRAEEMIERLRDMGDEGKHVEFTALEADPERGGDETAGLKEAVVGADVIFCTTPSRVEIFPAKWLTSEEGQAKKRYISAIGSYKLDMKEIPPAFLQAVTETSLGEYDPAQGGKASSGVIVVDSREACFLEAGEVVDAKIPAAKILEVGDIVHTQETVKPAEKDALKEWLEDGLVVYKSVGVGIMDLALGKALLQLAGKHGVGVQVPDF